MRHDTHCHACGTAMLATDENCANPDCGTPANQEPVWPCEGCAGCNERWIGLRIGLKILIAVILLLVAIDILTLSGRFLIVAGVLSVGWFINRLMYAWILSTEEELATQTAKAEQAQQDFSRLGSPTPEDRKKLKDEYDEIRSLDWKLARNVWWRRNVFTTQAMIILLIGLTFGPGRVIPWTAEDVVSVTKQKAVNSSIAEKGEELWSEAQTKQLWNLLRERDVTYTEFNAITAHENYNAGIAIDTAKKSAVFGPALQKEIASSFSKTQPEEERKLPKKGKLQSYREIIWLIYLATCGVCLFVWLGMIGVGFITLFMQIGWGVLGEGFDIIGLFIDKALEKRGLMSPTQPIPPGGAGGMSAVISKHGVLTSVLGSSIAEVLVKWIARK